MTKYFLLMVIYHSSIFLLPEPETFKLTGIYQSMDNCNYAKEQLMSSNAQLRNYYICSTVDLSKNNE